MKWLSLCALILFCIAITCIGALVYLAHHPWVDLASLQHTATLTPSIILDDEGSEWTRFTLEKQRSISLASIPKTVIHAFLATEDRAFYHHTGISWQGIIRSIVYNIYHGRFAQGASTITQQLVRILFFSTQKTMQRKIKEQFLSLVVECTYSKDQILEAYLNHIYFGCGIYGVVAAAQRFWNKKVTELTLAEAALLAGIVQSPRTYCPLLNPGNSLKRRNIVLSCMRAAGYITDREYERASVLPVTLTHEETNTCIAPHARNMIRTILEEQFGKQALYTRGLIVKTTLNSAMQKSATDTFRRHIEVVQEKLSPVIDGAALTIEVATGAVKVLIGGYEYATSQMNRAIHAHRQLGSIFKPLIYATALEQGMLLTDTAYDEPVRIQDNHRIWEPRNVTRTFDGQMTLAAALMHSNNIISLKLVAALTPERIVHKAQQAGISAPLAPYLSLALGCIDTSLWEATALFNIFAHQGIYVKPYLISWIQDARAVKVWSHQPEEIRIFSWTISSMIAHGLETTFNRLKKLPYMPYFTASAALGKTGTTNDARTCWFVGSTPQYTTAIYIGNDKNQPLPGMYATRTVLPLWLTMNERFPQPVKQFTYAPGLEEVCIHKKTGMPCSSEDPYAITVLQPPYLLSAPDRHMLSLDSALAQYQPPPVGGPCSTNVDTIEQIPEHWTPDAPSLPLPAE